MWGNLSKFTPIFLFLLLSGLVFLLRNIHSLEKLNCRTVSAFYHLQHSIDTNFRAQGLTWSRNHSYCGSAWLPLSLEEAAEEHVLLESLSWPEAPLPTGPVHQSSDPAHSFFVILTAEGKWHVGDHLEVLVHMRDFRGQPKRHGGDFLLARLHSPELQAGVAGRVVDHDNGLYSVLFWLPWAGPARVQVTLVHPSEAVQVLRRLRKEHPDRVYFKSQFRSGHLSETTTCNLCLSSRLPLCNYTNRHTGEPWFCFKPKLLGCDTRVSHSKGGYQKHLLSAKEEQLFQSKINIKVPIPASGSASVIVHPANKETLARDKRLDKFMPSGFYYQDVWRATSGVPLQQFDSTAAVTRCLQGRMVHMLGDSTVRQWFEYLTAFLPDIKEFNQHSPKKVGPFLSVDSIHNILLSYRCHGPPIRFSSVEANQLRYVADELDGITGGSDTVVVLSVWSHFSTFPVEVYIRRLRAIRGAVLRLLDRAPSTLVVLRTANPQALDPEVSLYNSDWFSLQLDTVLRRMFLGVEVLLVDAWEMTLAHHLPHALHPPPTIIKNTVDVFLSHVCPKKVL